jgi:predicted nucleic acid-binding protein
MIVALDASITIARSHPDETTSAILEVFEMVAQEGAWAPPLWKVEIANVVQMQVQRKRYDVHERDRILADIAMLNVAIDNKAVDQLWRATIDLAHRHRLTVYDAIYLEVALRRNLPLATLDRDLRAAALREGLVILGL